jgi:hypothetical protein
MFINKFRAVAAIAFGAVTLLSAVDAEAARCHRHRRSCCYEPCMTVCCDPCPKTCYDPCPTACPAPCATTWCDPCRGTIVVERAVVTGCCVATMSSATTVIATTERPASALAVSLASRGR